MKLFFIFFICLFLSMSFFAYGESESEGKHLFYNAKGKYGSCNLCHRNGSSAGRWNFETESVDEEEGRKIPKLIGVGKRKDHEQLVKTINYMKKLFDFKLTDKQIEDLADYVSTL